MERTDIDAVFNDPLYQEIARGLAAEGLTFDGFELSTDEREQFVGYTDKEIRANVVTGIVELALRTGMPAAVVAYDLADSGAVTALNNLTRIVAGLESTINERKEAPATA